MENTDGAGHGGLKRQTRLLSIILLVVMITLLQVNSAYSSSGFLRPRLRHLPAHVTDLKASDVGPPPVLERSLRVSASQQMSTKRLLAQHCDQFGCTPVGGGPPQTGIPNPAGSGN